MFFNEIKRIVFSLIKKIYVNFKYLYASQT